MKPNPCLKTKEKYVSFKFLLKFLETKFQPSQLMMAIGN